MRLSFSVSLCLSVRLSICLSVRLSFSLSACLSASANFKIPLCVYSSMSVFVSVCKSARSSLPPVPSHVCIRRGLGPATQIPENYARVHLHHSPFPYSLGQFALSKFVICNVQTDRYLFAKLPFVSCLMFLLRTHIPPVQTKSNSSNQEHHPFIQLAGLCPGHGQRGVLNRGRRQRRKPLNINYLKKL